MTGINVESTLISVAVGVVLPGLVALVTKEKASDKLKAFLTALIAAVSGALTGTLSALPHGWHDWQAVLWQIFIAWVAAATAYLTGWKPSGAAQAIAARTRNFGLGHNPPEAGYARLPLFVLGTAIGAAVALVFSEIAMKVGRELLVTLGILTATGVAVVVVLIADGYLHRWTYTERPSLDPGIVRGHERRGPRTRT